MFEEQRGGHCGTRRRVLKRCDKRPEGSVKEGLNRSLEHLGLCSESAGKASESFEQRYSNKI